MKTNIGIYATQLNFDQRKRLPGVQFADFCWQEAEVERISDRSNRFVVVGKPLSQVRKLCAAPKHRMSDTERPIVWQSRSTMRYTTFITRKAKLKLT